MKPKIKLLHTADLHLGARFIGLGDRGAIQRRRLREAVLDIARLAVQEQVDAILMAGDVFDHTAPSPESISAFMQALQMVDAMQIPVILIAGTHDHLGDYTVLARLEKEGAFVLLTPNRPVWERADRQLMVQGVSLIEAGRPERPLAALHRRPDCQAWQIGMAHASLEVIQQDSQEARFSAAEIAATGLDYLALGHWHGLRDCSQGGVVSWYSGPPEMIALDESLSGSVLIVTLEEGRSVQVTPRRIGRRTYLRLAVEAKSVEAILDRVRPAADPEAVLELTLNGILPPELHADPDEIHRQLASLFFHVRLKDQSVSELTPEELERFPETTVIGKFIRSVQAEMSEVDALRRQELQQALQLGMALLLGREVNLWS